MHAHTNIKKTQNHSLMHTQGGLVHDSVIEVNKRHRPCSFLLVVCHQSQILETTES